MTRYMHTLPATFQAPDFLPIRLLPHADEAKYFVSQIVTKTAVKDTDPWGCVRLHHDFLRRVMDKDCIAAIVNGRNRSRTRPRGIEYPPHAAIIQERGWIVSRYG